MRMKEDAMKNGQLKAGYNVQTGAENRFAIGYDIFDNPADMRTLPVHIENGEKRLGCTFKITIADAGYGSEENYEYLNKIRKCTSINYLKMQSIRRLQRDGLLSVKRCLDRSRGITTLRCKVPECGVLIRGRAVGFNTFYYGAEHRRY